MITATGPRGRGFIGKPTLRAQLVSGHPLSIGLLGFWAFNEGAGSLARNLVDNKLATANASPTWTPDGVTISSYRFQASGFQQISRFSIHSVFRRNGSQAVNSYVVSESAADGNFFIGFNNTGAGASGGDQLFTGFFAGGGWRSSGGTLAPDLTWINVLGTYDQSNVRLYVDGQLKLSPAQTTAIGTPGTSVFIGADSGTAFFAGGIASVAIWNRALSPEEAMLLYLDPYAPLESPSNVSAFPDPASLALSPSVFGNFFLT